MGTARWWGGAGDRGQRHSHTWAAHARRPPVAAQAGSPAAAAPPLTRASGRGPRGPQCVTERTPCLPGTLREATRPVLCCDHLAGGRTAQPQALGPDHGARTSRRSLLTAVGTVPLPPSAGGGTSRGLRPLPDVAHARNGALPPGRRRGRRTRLPPQLRTGPASREDAGQWSLSSHSSCYL